ncbi:MAG: DedA family protein [Deltaproteobacteria bacterium]|nr:DedA family protein [Deltaproteobacteria bacterium]
MINIFLHLDQHLSDLLLFCGPWIYLPLFLIIFCETGLVVTPFLPGDSLLFALGALAARNPTILQLPILLPLLTFAAILGDAVNYAIGSLTGSKLSAHLNHRWLNKKHLEQTQAFYEKHGGKTILLARFIPIIRTFAPFVAGMGRMGYRRFAFFNVVGGILWILLFVLAGYFFGNMMSVKRNFELVILSIIVISVLPPVIGFIRSRTKK